VFATVTYELARKYFKLFKTVLVLILYFEKKFYDLGDLKRLEEI
jgi:hypothetical protein